MENILTVTREDIQRFKGKNANKAPVTVESPFTCEWKMTSPDVLNDIHWSKDGAVQAEYLRLASEFLIQHYGRYAQLAIEPKGPTIIRYQVVVSKITDLEIEPTRGQNPHFYDGFMSASVGAAIHATKLDPTRVSQQKLVGEWLKGYVMHCALETQAFEDDDMARRKAPYQTGVVAAYEDSINKVLDPVFKMEDNSLTGREFMKGYVDFIGMNKHVQITLK